MFYKNSMGSSWHLTLVRMGETQKWLKKVVTETVHVIQSPKCGLNHVSGLFHSHFEPLSGSSTYRTTVKCH